MSLLLQVGDPLPRMTLTARGMPFRIVTGARGSLLYFMRTADCPVCRAHVRRLIALHPQFQAAGLATHVVVPDEQAEAVGRDLSPPFPVLNGDGHLAVGLRRVFFSTVQQSGTVVANAQGIVRLLHRASLPTGAFDEDAVLDYLSASGG